VVELRDLHHDTRARLLSGYPDRHAEGLSKQPGREGRGIREAKPQHPPGLTTAAERPLERRNDHPSGRTNRRPSITQRRAKAPLSAPGCCAVRCGPQSLRAFAVRPHPHSHSRGHPDKPQPSRQDEPRPTRPRAAQQDDAPGDSYLPPGQRRLTPDQAHSPSTKPETPHQPVYTPHGAADSSRARSAAMNATASGQKCSTSTCITRWNCDRR